VRRPQRVDPTFIPVSTYPLRERSSAKPGQLVKIGGRYAVDCAGWTSSVAARAFTRDTDSFGLETVVDFTYAAVSDSPINHEATPRPTVPLASTSPA